MINTRGTRRRLALSVIGVFVIVAVFVIRLVDIQIVRADELNAQANARQTATVTTYGTRGAIVDANGVVLADSVDRFDITASPKNVNAAGFEHTAADGTKSHISLTDAIGEIAAITGQTPTELLAALTTDPTSDFTYLTKAVKLDVFQQVKALGIPWVYSEPHPARSYPNGAVAGNLVGFVGTDGAQAGTELKQDACLAPSNGTSSYEMSADGVRLPGSAVVQSAASDGGTVELTIDSDLQWFTQQALAQQGTAVGAQWGTAIVVDVKTGEIKAAADWPSVDPNNVNLVGVDALGSRTFTTPYEPGSVIKPATVAGLVDAGLVTAATPVDVPSRFTDGLPAGSYIKDAWAHGDLHLTVAGVIMNSSNIGIAELSKLQSAQDRHDNLAKFGLGNATGVGFLGESSGTLIPVNKLDSITSVTQQFGQGVTATSAQVAGIYQTLGNGGVRLPLTLVKGCVHPDGSVTGAPSAQGTRVVSSGTATSVVQMMETVASDGSLRNVIGIPGYRIAAKTGTAQVAQNGRYGTDRIVSVAGLVPAENPQYAIVVTLVKPGTIKTSAAAAPAFNAIMKQVIKTFRVTPSTEPAPSIPLTW